ncbi:MAG: peptidoglycan-binding protein LysM [Thermodesulfobacteriota bacterium]
MAEKAEIRILDTDETIPVEFYNPTEYSVSTAAELSGEGSNLQFTKVNLQDFSVTLFFDTYEKEGGERDVRKETDKIASLVVPDVEGKDTKQPPTCLFTWGNFAYKGIIHKIDQKFTMFLHTGIPVRAELTVAFKPVVTSEEDAKLKGKDSCRKFWTVKTGDRLDLIADKALKDARMWHRIAEENKITNPMAFPSKEDIGRVLVIPDIYRKKKSG